MNLRLVGGGILVLAMFSGCPKPCQQDSECDDGLLCNGAEACLANRCAVATAKFCDDGLACTTDICSEDQRRCISTVIDADGDGQGASSCRNARGDALGTDCDDTNANRFSGNLEVCDVGQVDEDCDPLTLGGLDGDRDGYVDARCANPALDGGFNRGTDCDDTKEAIHPGQAELCNFVDDNCNGVTDEGVSSLRFKDEDNDGWGAGAGTPGCNTEGTSHLGTDCDDANPAMNPGQFRCVTGAAGQYDLCTRDGGFERGSCVQAACRPQPNGLGVCL
jgi:hypothetical protein